MTVHAFDAGVRAVKQESVGVLKLRHLCERPFLTMTRRAVLAVATVVDVVVATCTALAEPGKSLFSRRKHIHVGKEMTLVARDALVLSYQHEIEPRMIEEFDIRYSCQRKTLQVDLLKLFSMVFQMALSTILRQVRRHATVKSGLALNLSADVLVTVDTRSGHRNGCRAVAGGTLS